jgi:hypothetical protein
MSGSRSSLQVGQNTSYVAKVGTNIGNNLNQVTVETERLTTGFELTLYGSENGGAIYTDINLSVSELLRFNSFTALGTDLTLPQTADRKIQTIVAARPGDVILLGGISVGRDNADITNAVGGNNKETTANRGELVIAIRPKVVRFVKRPPGASAAAARATVAPPPLTAPTAVLPVDWVDPVGGPQTAAEAVAPAAVGTGPAPVMPPVIVAPVVAPPTVVAPPPSVTRVATAAPGAYRAQFGAYRSGADAARAAWSLLQATHPGLKDLTPDIVRESFGGQMLWLLRTAPMGRDDVQRLCSDVRRAGDPCAVVRIAPAAAEGGG